MAESILNGKRILAVDDEPDVLSLLAEEIRWAAPGCQFERAATYEEGAQKLKSQNYDVVILDIMGVSRIRSFRLGLEEKSSCSHAHCPFSQSRVSKAFY